MTWKLKYAISQLSLFHDAVLYLSSHFFGLFFPLHWMNRSLCFSTIDKTQVKIKSIPTLIRGATAEGHVGCNKPWVIFQQVGKLDPEAALLAREDISAAAAAAAKLRQSCPTLCNPIDGSPAGSSVPGILQARILEWVAISFSILNIYSLIY